LAYKRFFSKLAGFPNRKKKNQHDSVRFPDPKQIKVIEPRSKIQLPKLGLVKYINARPILGMVKNATLSRKADK
jgi:putative transposase